jgi:ABC-type antimicrobial peptide transport system permease subunit
MRASGRRRPARLQEETACVTPHSSAAEYAQKAPHLVIFPGVAISLAVFGSNLLGDALRDTLDPRLRGA